jgi:chromate reductase, NAD(P)H dehydrogenase (quinone)
MKKIIAFAGSNSSTSINHDLVVCAVHKLKKTKSVVIRLTDYPLPMFGEDMEREEGYPDILKELLDEIKEADGLLLSVNEHNGTVSAFFKNVLDWLSRLEYKFLTDKKVFLMSTSDGRRGALSANEYTARVLPRFGAAEIYTFLLPSFSTTFNQGAIIDPELNAALDAKLAAFEVVL